MKNISLITLVQLAIRHIAVIVISAFVFAACTFSYCQFIAVPRYSATAPIIVTNGAIVTDSPTVINGGSSVSIADINASLSLVPTIVDILKTDNIYKELSKEINYKYSYSELRGRASVSRRDDTTIFVDVSFSSTTPEEAISLLNQYLALVPEYVGKHIPNSTTTAFNNIEVASKTFPRTYLSTIAMALLGAVCSFAIILLVNQLNNTIRDEDDFKSNYDITVIGAIPDFATAKSKYYYKSYSKGDYSNVK